LALGQNMDKTALGGSFGATGIAIIQSSLFVSLAKIFVDFAISFI
jgi:hypothetical protein